MKILKKVLRWWISLASVAGFIFGWVFIARASEANFANNPNGNGTSINPQTGLSTNFPQILISPSTSNQFFTPRLRTGGS